MKKILALAMSIIMIVASSVCVFADPINSAFESDIPPVIKFKNVEVETTLEIGKDNAGFATSYVDSQTSIGNTYDLKGKISMDMVNLALEKLAEFGKSYSGSELDVLSTNLKSKFSITVKFAENTLVDSVLSEDFEMSLDAEDGAFKTEALKVESMVPTVDTATNTLKLDVEYTIAGSDAVKEEGGKMVSRLGESISIVCEDIIKAKDFTTYTYNVASFTGETDILTSGGAQLVEVTYKFGTPTATLTLSETDDDGGSGGGGGGARPSGVIKPPATEDSGDSDKTHKVEYYLGTGAETKDDTTDKHVASGTEVKLPEDPVREGFVFAGWQANGVPVSDALEITEDTVISARWINLTVPADLNGDDHIAYIKGYPEGDVRPEDNITREEVATIFYRLLKDAKREELETSENNFADVEEERWSNIAISTLSNGGYINGYPDGSFRPEDTITRAEFVTIASKFIQSVDTKSYFKDIDGHWAEQHIATATDSGWINGYEDGTFRPDNTITRAEVMKIVNSVLVRYSVEENLTVEGIKLFPDNHEDSWYYHDVIEATNGHEHTRRENGYHEDWSEIIVTDILG